MQLLYKGMYSQENQLSYMNFCHSSLLSLGQIDKALNNEQIGLDLSFLIESHE